MVGGLIGRVMWTEQAQRTIDANEGKREARRSQVAGLLALCRSCSRDGAAGQVVPIVV